MIISINCEDGRVVAGAGAKIQDARPLGICGQTGAYGFDGSLTDPAARRSFDEGMRDLGIPGQFAGAGLCFTATVAGEAEYIIVVDSGGAPFQLGVHPGCTPLAVSAVCAGQPGVGDFNCKLALAGAGGVG